jgi:hypothetical protein
VAQPWVLMLLVSLNNNLVPHLSAGLILGDVRSTPTPKLDPRRNQREVTPNSSAVEVPAHTGDAPGQLSSSAAPPEVQLPLSGASQGKVNIGELQQLNSTVSAGLIMCDIRSTSTHEREVGMLNGKVPPQCKDVDVPATTEDVPLQLASTDSPPAVHLSFTEVHLDTNPNDMSVYEDSAEGRYTPPPSADGDPVPLVDITSDQETSIAHKTPNNSNTQVRQKSVPTPPIFQRLLYFLMSLYLCIHP